MSLNRISTLGFTLIIHVLTHWTVPKGVKKGAVKQFIVVRLNCSPLFFSKCIFIWSNEKFFISRLPVYENRMS